jgi:MFS family permease
VEESTLAHLTPPEARSDIFAWYSLIGTAGTAFGMMTCGWVTHALQANHGLSNIRAYRIIFFAYAVIGLIKFLLAMSLSQKCEAEKKASPTTDTETAPLLGHNGAKKSKPSISLLPSISKESRVIVANLCLLFALDAFASGLAPL